MNSSSVDVPKVASARRVSAQVPLLKWYVAAVVFSAVIPFLLYAFFSEGQILEAMPTLFSIFVEYLSLVFRANPVLVFTIFGPSAVWLAAVIFLLTTKKVVAAKAVASIILVIESVRFFFSLASILGVNPLFRHGVVSAPMILSVVISGGLLTLLVFVSMKIWRLRLQPKGVSRYESA